MENKIDIKSLNRGASKKQFPISNRIAVIAAVTLSLVVMISCIFCFKAVLPGKWGTGIRWQYVQRLFFVLLPLCMMLFLRRPPSLYGLSLSRMPREMGIGLAIAVWLIGMTFLFGVLFHGFTWALKSMDFRISHVVSNLVFAGFCEELLYRGYCQGELNRVFARPFAMGRTRYGWPVFLAAAMFALVHMFGQFNPLEGRWRLDLLPLLYTFPAGIAFGIAREHFNGILSVALIHGGSNLAFGLYDSLETKIVAEAAFWLVCVYIYRRATREVSSIEPSVTKAGTDPATDR